jgi:hypothetical protein
MHEDNSLTEFFMLLTSGQKHWRMFRCVMQMLVVTLASCAGVYPRFNVDAPRHFSSKSDVAETLGMCSPASRLLVYHDPDYNTFTADAFKPDLDAFPLLAYTGTL